jgi:hypothetical protein
MAQLTVAQRIVELAEAGWTNADIAHELRTTPPTVAYWRQRDAAGDRKLANKPGSGRKAGHTAQQRKAVKQLARRGKTAVQIQSMEPYANFSTSTIHRIIKGGRRPLAWLPVLRGRRLSADNKSKRVTYCSGLRCTDGRRRISCDSKYFYLYRDEAGHLCASWQYPDERVMHPAHPNPMVFHVYAAITYGGKSKLVFVPPTRGVGGAPPNGKVNFNSTHFIAAITKLHKWSTTSLPTGTTYTWLLDHAKQHTSNASRAAMRGLGLQLEPGYPAQSWDLNPIEVAWGMLVGEMHGCRARSVEGFKRALQSAWGRLPQDSINRLMDKWGEAVRGCVEREGQWPSTGGVV